MIFQAFNRLNQKPGWLWCSTFCLHRILKWRRKVCLYGQVVWISAILMWTVLIWLQQSKYHLQANLYDSNASLHLVPKESEFFALYLYNTVTSTIQTLSWGPLVSLWEVQLDYKRECYFIAGRKRKKKRLVWEVKMETNIKTENSYTEQDFKTILFGLICS